MVESRARLKEQLEKFATSRNIAICFGAALVLIGGGIYYAADQTVEWMANNPRPITLKFRYKQGTVQDTSGKRYKDRSNSDYTSYTLEDDSFQSTGSYTRLKVYDDGRVSLEQIAKDSGRSFISTKKSPDLDAVCTVNGVDSFCETKDLCLVDIFGTRNCNQTDAVKTQIKSDLREMQKIYIEQVKRFKPYIRRDKDGKR